MKKRIIKMWLKGMYVSDKKEICKHIADSFGKEHRRDLIEKLLPEGTHLHKNPASKLR
jgi:hypothetical protein